MKPHEIEHKMMMETIGLAAQLLTPQAGQMAALIEAERSMHSHLHITDPTLYRKAIHSKALAQQVRLARAALAFVREAQAVKAELAEADDA
ncbi:MAG TPA: hypothetical protein PKD10_16095 [Paracoccaceae bacterium]|nr:hypothetical protein [Paracoccaceae bacterium]HMO73145.1 hypothetical protein [Paracoccaceae bacterium]